MPDAPRFYVAFDTEARTYVLSDVDLRSLFGLDDQWNLASAGTSGRPAAPGENDPQALSVRFEKHIG